MIGLYKTFHDLSNGFRTLSRVSIMAATDKLSRLDTVSVIQGSGLRALQRVANVLRDDWFSTMRLDWSNCFSQLAHVRKQSLKK